MIAAGPCRRNKNIFFALLFSVLVIEAGLTGGCGRKSDDYYENNYVIPVNPAVSLHGQTKAAIYALRKSKVEEQKITGIFPVDYEPRETVFGAITDGANWVDPAQFYISNPYLLVLTSSPEHVTTLMSNCPVNSVDYSHRRIDVKYAGDSASMWFYYIYDYYTESPGLVRLWFVNAYDAGFNFAHVDSKQSVNIDPAWYASEDSVTRGVYTGREWFHFGSQQKNNLSPVDNKAALRLTQRGVKTVIFVKLWKERPKNMDSEEDFSYVISIEP